MRRITLNFVFGALAGATWLLATPATAEQVQSPDGALTLEVGVNSFGAAVYSVNRNGEEVIRESRLGMHFANHHPFDQGFELAGTSTGSSDSTWEQPWGERRLVRDIHQELLATFRSTKAPSREFRVRFRVFDDGLGFRYEIPDQSGYDDIEIVDELTEFHVDPDARAWWTPGRRFNRYEYIYHDTSIREMPLAHTPVTMKLDSGVHVSIHEAALVDYAAFVLDQGRDGILTTNLTPWSDGIDVKTSTPFNTPWRTIQISPDAVGLLNSDLILNLNEPNQLGDVSWFTPGKYVGIWWAMHIGTRTWGSGPKHGATTEETIRYLDFAAEHGFSGVLVEGWNIGWDGDWFHNGELFSFTQPYPDFDIDAVAEHARKVGVPLIGHHETSGAVTHYEAQMEDAFDFYQKHGVRVVKSGYVADAGDILRVDENGLPHYEWHDGQFMVNHHLRAVQAAARRQIAINPHEPVKDTGLRRTYPNWVSREGVRGQEFNAWGDPPNPVDHTTVIAFTRMLSGPADFTPGIFDLTFKGMDSPNRVQTTLARQLALYVVLYSPIQMAADLPENYEARPDAFQFIKDVPADWEKSVALAGEVGDFVAFARQVRGGHDWYIGAATDESARQLELTMDFLDADVAYTATIYRDGDDAHWKTNPYALTIETRELERGDKLTLSLAAGGGAAVTIKRP